MTREQKWSMLMSQAKLEAQEKKPEVLPGAYLLLSFDD